ncbi:MAG: hypothetical protein QOG05_2275 [Streptosporangiaceae bacterium]|nr:hypothetical protein [Streptosporangiaceae bacterium]
MPNYRDVAAVREFRALFGGRAAACAAGTMTMLAMAVLVYADTCSPLLAALAYLAGSLPQVLAAMTLLALADRLQPRRLLAGWELLDALAIALLALDVLPVWAALVVLMAAGASNGIASGASYALLADVLPGQYVLGRSVLNMADRGMQVLGYGAGGAPLAALGAVPGAAGSRSPHRAGRRHIPVRARATAHPRTRPRTLPPHMLNNKAPFGNSRARGLLIAQ